MYIKHIYVNKIGIMGIYALSDNLDYPRSIPTMNIHLLSIFIYLLIENSFNRHDNIIIELKSRYRNVNIFV